MTMRGDQMRFPWLILSIMPSIWQPTVDVETIPLARLD
jgi:hypothetical protein